MGFAGCQMNRSEIELQIRFGFKAWEISDLAREAEFAKAATSCTFFVPRCIFGATLSFPGNSKVDRIRQMYKSVHHAENLRFAFSGIGFDANF